MDVELFDALEKKVEALIGAYAVLKHENERLREENHLLLEERNRFRTRIDSILKKLDEV